MSCLAGHEAMTENVTTPDVGAALSGKMPVQLSQVMPEQSLGYADWAANHDIGYLGSLTLAYPKDMRAGACDALYSSDPAEYARC